MPINQPGPECKDDRRIISGTAHVPNGTAHVPNGGGRWQDVPGCYGTATTVHNRFHRWSQRGIWQPVLAA
ncbi:MAG: transposase [Acetobacteraceae bacterium]